MRIYAIATSFVCCLLPHFAFAQVETDLSSGGGVRIGDSSTTCNSSIAGAIRYDADGTNGFGFCDGSSWLDFSTGTSNPVVNNGNSFSAPMILGTNDSNSLSLETAGTTRMTLDTSGNVGIGSASPSEALDVNGAIRLGTTSNSNSGSIRYNGSDLQGYVSGAWQSLTNPVDITSSTSNPIAGTLTIPGGASTCSWSVGGTSFASYTSPESTCTAAVTTGLASAPTEGKIPAIRFATLPAGSYMVIFEAWMGSSNEQCYWRLYDGATASGLTNSWYDFGEGTNLTGFFQYASDQTNKTFYLQAARIGSGTQCGVTANTALEHAKYTVVSLSSSGDFKRDGSLSMTGDLNMGTYTIQNLGTPSNSNDAATKAYVDSNAGLWTLSSGDIYYNSGNVGIGLTNPNVALDVSGDIEFTGVITDVSDRRLKENIQPLEQALSKLLNIDGVSFYMKDDPKKRTEFGVIAQDVEDIFPELVHQANDKEKTRSVNYIGFIGWMIEAFKELNGADETLRDELYNQKRMIQSLQEKTVRLESLLEEKEAKLLHFEDRLNRIDRRTSEGF